MTGCSRKYLIKRGEYVLVPTCAMRKVMENTKPVNESIPEAIAVSSETAVEEVNNPDGPEKRASKRGIRNPRAIAIII